MSENNVTQCKNDRDFDAVWHYHCPECKAETGHFSLQAIMKLTYGSNDVEQAKPGAIIDIPCIHCGHVSHLDGEKIMDGMIGWWMSWDEDELWDEDDELAAQYPCPLVMIQDIWDAVVPEDLR